MRIRLGQPDVTVSTFAIVALATGGSGMGVGMLVLALRVASLCEVLPVVSVCSMLVALFFGDLARGLDPASRGRFRRRATRLAALLFALFILTAWQALWGAACR